MPVTILLIMQFSAGVRKISTILSSTKNMNFVHSCGRQYRYDINLYIILGVNRP